MQHFFIYKSEHVPSKRAYCMQHTVCCIQYALFDGTCSDFHKKKRSTFAKNVNTCKNIYKKRLFFNKR